MVRTVFVEDRSLMLDALKNAIKWEDWDIEPIGFFSTCDEALPFIEEKMPDVVVTDIVMHGMDGLELSRYLHESGMDVKVIIVSAYNRFDYAQKALQAGVFDFFEKPLDFDALASCILRAGKVNAHVRQMRAFIKKHREFYRERFFTKLMLGQMENAQNIQSEAEFLEVDRLGGMLCVAFCLIEDRKVQNGTMSQELMRLMLGGKLCDGLEGGTMFGPYSLREEETVFILAGEMAARKHEVLTLVTQVSEDFAKANGITVQAGIGCRAEAHYQLKQSYEAATRALDACFSFDEGCVIHIDDLHSEGGSFWLTMRHFEDQLVRAISIQDAVAVQAAFDRLQNEISRLYLQSDILRVMMKGVVFKVESLLIASESGIDSVLAEIERAKSLEEMLDAVVIYCQKVCRMIQSARQRQGKQVCKTAKAYINENFTSEALSVNEIADYIGISSNYLSSVFKREYRQGIHEYITALRIERAREMLIHTDKSVGAIGAAVGYPNPYHFSMNFKKHTNMAPTEYRKKNQP